MKREAAGSRQSGLYDQTPRLRIVVHGAVQGVGFRPFIYRLAAELRLTGWVGNCTHGVIIEVEGNRGRLESFLLRLEKEKPPRSFIQSLESSFLEAKGFTRFEIRASDDVGEKTAIVLPDIATCPDCWCEIFDSNNRRYLYPFTNCTNCGPRFSIMEALPYDRANTAMRNFVMCGECQAEYENPFDRRFHAQPNACPRCGPHLELWDRDGTTLSSHHQALLAAANAMRAGKIVAVKGLGGFHLLVDARNDEAVQALRQRRQRAEKPFALMYPLPEQIRADCEVSEIEARLLLSPEAPIVLLRRNQNNSAIAPSIAPGTPYLGVMLPYTPLHHLLMFQLGFPVVATSGNFSDEPICTDEREALERLSGIADLFLVHNRPITRHVDDSIVRVMLGRELMLRRARGYAPLPIEVRTQSSTSGSRATTLAVGAHLKNTIALSAGAGVFVSQHLGDLATPQAIDAFQQVIASFTALYAAQPAIVACDAHPDYRATRFAQESGLPTVIVQHHYAHILSCMAENEIEGSVLGIAWDGTGYGLDGTIWGGEFLKVTEDSFQRLAHLRTFCLPGNEMAVREPRRAALGLLSEIFGSSLFEMNELAPVKAFRQGEQRILQAMLEKRINSPVTSSAGRLFDAVASIIGLRQRAGFEGQAAMELEFALDGVETDEVYDFQLTAQPDNSTSASIVDWEPMIRAVISDVQRGVAAGSIAAKFHNTLAEMIVAIARRAGLARVALSGGCFQNKYLTERACGRLTEEGFRVYFHQRIPPNDGGIALGQVIAVLRLQTKE
ncbi:MAG: carbamoyltransferase HypF [Blastocatellia bacterium]